MVLALDVAAKGRHATGLESSSIGRLVGELSDAAFVADPLSEGCPFIGMSKGFAALTGYASEELIGRTWDALLEGVPVQYVSRSARQDAQDYIAACQSTGLWQIAEVQLVQPNRRRDGGLFVNFLLLGHCHFQGQSYIIGVPSSLGEGAFVQASRVQLAQAFEDARAVFKRVQGLFRSQTFEVADLSSLSKLSCSEFGFYAERLQDRCVLMDGGRTAMRREAGQVPRGCLLFGDRPLRPKAGSGLAFEVRVVGVTQGFSGLPVLGFTRRRPLDCANLYPSVAKCLGASALIGGTGTASARDEESHFKIGFRPPPAVEVSEWPASLSETEAAGATLQDGDVLRVAYTEEGRLELTLNGSLILACDTGRQLDADAEYFAVVDVCLEACGVTLIAPRARGFTVESLASTADFASSESAAWTSDSASECSESPDEPDCSNSRESLGQQREADAQLTRLAETLWAASAKTATANKMRERAGTGLCVAATVVALGVASRFALACCRQVAPLS